MNPVNPVILCVDDEPTNLKLLEAMLLPRGYAVIKASDGTEALKKIKEHPIDLVLLDVMMPNLNGFDVCRMLKEDSRYREIPVVMITALQSKQDRIASIEAGAEDFISKPFDHTEVLARIRMLLRIRELHSRLHRAYANINDLIFFGEEMVTSFDPLNFELISKIDAIVGQILRRSDGDDDKPDLVIVGISDETNGRQWLLYKADGNAQKRVSLDFPLKRCLIAPGGEPQTGFLNQGQLEAADIGPLISVVESAYTKVRNVVSYHSEEICIHAFNYGREVTEYDAAILNSIVMQSLFLKSLSDQVSDTDNAFAYTVHALARASEVNDEDTGNHILRVGEYCGLIAEHLGMPEKFAGIIKLQALMHDVGKLHIPSEILKKPGRLTQEEFELVKQHPLYGAKIIGDHVRLTMAKEIALSHHERWDGSGYPNGLQGNQIPFTGRILNIADIYDALRNKRVYKPAFDHETTYRIITEGDGRTLPSHFDPPILQAFRETASRFEEIYGKMQE
ncbi:MAG: response regulator [Nitrospirae bacterium]|nr:response regulator [Nitrospirota bacterium]